MQNLFFIFLEFTFQIFKKEEPSGWIDADTLRCFKNGNNSDRCFFRSNFNGWNRLVSIDLDETFSQSVLTPDGVTISQFLGWDAEKDEAFILGTGYNMDPIKDPALRHLYVVRSNGAFDCMSCDIRRTEAANEPKCTYSSSVRFSTDYTYFSFTCGGPGLSYTHIVKNTSPLVVAAWEGNESLREILKEYLETKSEYIRVPVGPNKEFSAMVKCLMPACYNPASTKKYAMIIQVYAGKAP